MNILYSFNKTGFEANYWTTEIQAASDDDYTFIPFNHEPYLSPWKYIRAQLLDNLYYERHPGLMRLYGNFEKMLSTHKISVILVDTCPPYHPDYLRQFSQYKVLRIGDGPISAYDRDFAYCHAYDHVLYHSPAYSRDLDIAEKLRYCKVERSDFWPMCAFDALFDQNRTEETILSHDRDIDVIFIGTLHISKMPLLAQIKRGLGSRIVMRGLAPLKNNLYFNVKYGFPGWMRPVPFGSYVPLYQRSKIGINLHNRGDYTVGSYRLFDLPANGVMQISDGGSFLSAFYEVDKEIVSYASVDELIDKVRYYLDHPEERNTIASNGYKRVMKEYRHKTLMRRAGEIISRGIHEKNSQSDNMTYPCSSIPSSSIPRTAGKLAAL